MTDAAEIPTFEPAETLTIRSLDTVKAVSDPLRVRILEALYQEPRSVKQVAAEIGVPATKLYYHMNLLEEHGLIHTVSSRVVSGIIEKSYRIAARNLTVDKSLFGLNPAADDPLGGLVSVIFDGARDEIRAGVVTQQLEASKETAPRRRLLIGRTFNRLTAKRAQELFARLEALAEEFGAGDVDAAEPNSDLYGLVMAMYPVPRTVAAEEDHE